ncbi:hypothetical protein AURDEDRAFT_178095 [Auricularia subglabra TFB-10046 SS5]|uniref:Uncharacterized protein n=1 Tax=Auricularia subglabra (strain TFB-10046 / SS5) TaxID=717982 RepID=J0CRC2_AURST|nr:hypothetical protein AURDEDRAFT_178095 [Auricularia subglabra TFB-10046 SS5]
MAMTPPRASRGSVSMPLDLWREVADRIANASTSHTVGDAIAGVAAPCPRDLWALSLVAKLPSRAARDVMFRKVVILYDNSDGFLGLLDGEFRPATRSMIVTVPISLMVEYARVISTRFENLVSLSVLLVPDEEADWAAGLNVGLPVLAQAMNALVRLEYLGIHMNPHDFAPEPINLAGLRMLNEKNLKGLILAIDAVPILPNQYVPSIPQASSLALSPNVFPRLVRKNAALLPHVKQLVVGYIPHWSIFGQYPSPTEEVSDRDVVEADEFSRALTKVPTLTPVLTFLKLDDVPLDLEGIHALQAFVGLERLDLHPSWDCSLPGDGHNRVLSAISCARPLGPEDWRVPCLGFELEYAEYIFTNVLPKLPRLVTLHIGSVVRYGYALHHAFFESVMAVNHPLLAHVGIGHCDVGPLGQFAHRHFAPGVCSADPCDWAWSGHDSMVHHVRRDVAHKLPLRRAVAAKQPASTPTTT